MGITVDHRRTNKSEESLNTNVERLKSYKARLVIFPRRAGIFKKGDSTAAEIAEAQKQKADVDISALPKRADAVTFTAITEVIYIVRLPVHRTANFATPPAVLLPQELKAAKGYAALRAARTDARLVGRRLKQKLAKEGEKKDEKAE